MARKFITEREVRLFDSWNRETIQSISQQEIIYYQISSVDSVVDRLYDEAIVKFASRAVRINGRVEFGQEATEMEGGTMDSNFTLTVELHPKECLERNVNPREGDFVEFASIFYEISTVKKIEPVYGQMGKMMNYQLTCIPSREGSFKFGSSFEEGIDNSHTVPIRPSRTLGDDL